MAGNMFTLKPGSIKSTIANLSCLTIGIGCLTIPYAVSKSGLVLGMLWNIIGLALSYWSNWMILKILDKTHKPSFIELKQILFGETAGKIVGSLWVVYFPSYFVVLEIICAKMIIKLVLTLAGYELSLPLIIISQTVFLVAPLLFFNGIGSMRLISIISVAIIGLEVLLIFIEMPWYLYSYKVYEKNIQYANWTLESSQKILIFVFGYLLLNGITVVMSELNNPSLKRMMYATNYVFLIQFIYYSFIGICGYVSTMNFTPESILERDMITKKDIASIVIGILCYFSILAHIPLNYYSFREELQKTIGIDLLSILAYDCNQKGVADRGGVFSGGDDCNIFP